MNIEKIGQFLKALRKERNLTQDQLAEYLNFDRTVISKWECGRKLPTVENFDALAKFYNVSINELVYGERMNKENAKEIKRIPIKIMIESQRIIHRVYTGCIMTILSAVFIVLICYFLSNYNSIKVYRVGGSTDNYVVKNTLMIISKHRSYLNFGEIDIIGDEGETISYDNYELYVKNGDTRIILASREDGDLVEGLEKIDNYLNFNNINKFINNIYVDIYDDNANIITIKLDATLEMTNNKVFYINDEDASNTENTKIGLKGKSLPNFVRKNFKYDESKELYTYSEIIDGENVDFEYDARSKEINAYYNKFKYNYKYDAARLIIFNVENEMISTEVVYDISSDSCNLGDCEKDKKEIEFFKNKLLKLLKN